MIAKSDKSHPSFRASKDLYRIKMRAISKGLDFDLTKKWILCRYEQGFCEQTGLPFNFNGGNGRHYKNKHAPSIDRIDSSKGYTQDNCQVVVNQYNMAKGMWSDSDVLELAIELINVAHGRQNRICTIFHKTKGNKDGS